MVKTKSGKSRAVPINDMLFEFFHARKNKSEYVFPNPKTGMPYVDLKRQFRNACRRADIKGLRFHDLRHTFASRLVEKGVDIETVRDLLGHSSITITQRYTHSTDERKRVAVELLSKGRVTQIVTQDPESKLIH